jgi:hypothetical protein
LWLHGDGLSPALLLNALAALTHVAAPEAEAEQEPEPDEPKIVISPPPQDPKPVIIERVKPLGWNSFGEDSRGTTDPGPDTVAGEASVPEVKGSLAPDPDRQSEMAKPVVEESSPEVEDAVRLETRPTPAADESKSNREPKPEPSGEIAPPAGTTGYCRECGSPHMPDHAFCTNCGARLHVAGE